MSFGLRTEGLPALDFWEVLLQAIDGGPKGPATARGPKGPAKTGSDKEPRDQPKLCVLEDNQSTMIVAQKGTSKQLKHVRRTHRVNIAWIAEVLASPDVEILYIRSEQQSADILTKAFTNKDKFVNLCHLVAIGQAPVHMADIRRTSAPATSPAPALRRREHPTCAVALAPAMASAAMMQPWSADRKVSPGSLPSGEQAGTASADRKVPPGGGSAGGLVAPSAEMRAKWDFVLRKMILSSAELEGDSFVLDLAKSLARTSEHGLNWLAGMAGRLIGRGRYTQTRTALSIIEKHGAWVVRGVCSGPFL